MATERISFLARSDDDDCKLGDNVSLWFGDGADGADNNTGDVSLTFDATNLVVAGGNVKLSDINLVLGTSTGTKIGTSASQKLGFYNATPIVQQTGVAVTAGGVHAALVALGLITA